MTACLNIAAFLGLSAALACRYKDRLVNVIPISTAMLILVLLALALFRALYLIDIIAGCTLIACAVFFVRAFGKGSGRELLRVLFSPSSAAFCCIVLLAFAFLRNACVISRDDLGCWAIEVKSIFFYNGFAPKFRNAAYSFGLYFPGTSLFRWWACHLFGCVNDGLLFVGSWWLLIFLAAPLLGCCQYGIIFAPAAALAGSLLFLLLPGTIDYISYASICTEPAMGAAFAGAFITLFEKEKPGSIPRLAAYLFMLCFFKASGMFFALVVLLFCFIYARTGQSESVSVGEASALLDSLARPREILRAAVCFVPTGIWYVYCLIMQRGNYYTASMKAMNEYGAAPFLKSFIHGFLFEPAHFTHDGVFDLPLAAVLLILALMAFIGWRAGLLKGKKYCILARYAGVIIAVYFIALLAVHCFVFREYGYLEATYMALSTAHYGLPIFFGAMLFLIYSMLSAAKSLFRQISVLAVSLAFAISCTCLWTVYYRFINTAGGKEQCDGANSVLTEQYGGLLALAQENKEGRCLFIYGSSLDMQDTARARLQYLSAPCSVITFEFDTESENVDSRLYELEAVFEKSHPNTVYVMQIGEELLSELVPRWIASGVTVICE